MQLTLKEIIPLIGDLKISVNGYDYDLDKIPNRYLSAKIVDKGIIACRDTIDIEVNSQLLEWEQEYDKVLPQRTKDMLYSDYKQEEYLRFIFRLEALLESVISQDLYNFLNGNYKTPSEEILGFLEYFASDEEKRRHKQ